MKKLKFVLAVLLAFVSGLSYADKYEDGAKAYKAGDYKTAVELWRPLAEQGFAKAQFNLGQSYAQGRGVQQNYEQAIKWFLKAADQGIVPAQNIHGHLPVCKATVWCWHFYRIDCSHASGLLVRHDCPRAHDEFR